MDADKIEFPLVLRPWKSGDFFYPLGMKHRKKLSDYFTDKKISRFDKEKFLVCLSAGNIVCILGLGIDERFRKSELLKLSLSWMVYGLHAR
ncbi:MAG: tRNA lysidine(34) synthetase TilS [Bacteroidetes bacterium]|nr:tRNA lysidine(34) synthetase TilS [Bacteroidota bacterium]